MDRTKLFSQLVDLWNDPHISFEISNNQEIDLEESILDHHLFITFTIEISEHNKNHEWSGGINNNHVFKLIDFIKSLEGYDQDGGKLDIKTTRVEKDPFDEETEVRYYNYFVYEAYFGKIPISEANEILYDHKPSQTKTEVGVLFKPQSK